MSSSHYKELCNEFKHDLKRKRRELEDAEDRLRRCESETKKAKVQSQEILQLYQGLQRELQLAYERNAKLQVDKASYEGLLDSERKEFETFKRQQTTSTEESKKLKDALCAMRLEKLELETKFNTIVMENKELRDRARQYEPRMREVDELKRKMVQIEQMINEQLKPDIKNQNECAQRAQVNQDQIERYMKWNDLLRRECDEKSQQLKTYSELVEFCRQMETERDQMQLQIDELATVARQTQGNQQCPNLDCLLLRIKQLRKACQDIEQAFRKEVETFKCDLVTALVQMVALASGAAVVQKSEQPYIEIGRDVSSATMASPEDC